VLRLTHVFVLCVYVCALVCFMSVVLLVLLCVFLYDIRNDSRGFIAICNSQFIRNLFAIVKMT